MMRLRTTLIGAAIAAIGFGVWMRGQQADTRQLAALVPPGALLYLEAKDFHSLLLQWNQSGEKARWLKSGNYSVVSQSRLIQRLSEAQGEFVSVAGFPVGMSLLDELAGGRSAISFYDVSYHMSFVYLTQLPEDRVQNTSLWSNRAGYQSREVAGIPFYLKTEAAGDGTRTVAFAVHNGWLVLATDESAIAETLVLLAGREARSLSVEPWFTQVEKEQPDRGDLHMVYNLSALIKTPQFRTYWIHRNASELKPFAAGISELYQRRNGFEERRILLRESPAAATNASGIGEALQYAPSNSSLYRAWAQPDGDRLRETIRQVVFGEKVVVQDFNAPAPVVTPEAGAVGSESDLEVRIDEPPFEREQTESIQPLFDAINAMQPTALLHVQTTTVLQDRVFVYPSSGLVAICAKPSQAALDGALAQLKDRVIADDLDPLSAKIEGNAVILSRTPLVRQANTDALSPDVVRVAAYNHAVEWPHYKKLFSLVDSAGAANPETSRSSGPPFFAGNLRGLGDSLARLSGVSITAADQGTKISEAVEYRFAEPK